MKTIKVTDIQPLRWEFSKPDHFPCMICNQAEATVRMTCRVHKGKTTADVNICACQACARLPESQLIDGIY